MVVTALVSTMLLELARLNRLLANVPVSLEEDDQLASKPGSGPRPSVMAAVVASQLARW